MTPMKNKTWAVWITLLGGPLGLHRLYLRGRWDGISALWCVPTLLGSYGMWRARTLGLDDGLSWLLIPLLGFTAAACAAMALVHGVSDTEKWNRRHNPQAALDAPAGNSNWFTVIGMALALFAGAIVLMASIAFSFQRYFEYQYNQAKAQEAPAGIRKSSD